MNLLQLDDGQVKHNYGQDNYGNGKSYTYLLNHQKIQLKFNETKDFYKAKKIIKFQNII